MDIEFAASYDAGMESNSMTDEKAQPCAFCRIACGLTPARVVDEGVEWTSFPPLGPHAPGHMLFVPRRHVRDATVEPALTGTVFAAAAAYLGRVLRSEGNILTSVGPSATQTVMHLHVHVIPRGAEDGLHHDWPWCRESSEHPSSPAQPTQHPEHERQEEGR